VWIYCRRNPHRIIAATLILLLVFSVDATSQCAMCKAVAETGSKDGTSVSGGINNAILYLMTLPYIILFLLFRKKLVGFFREWKAMWK
jgi:hypothetical protein